MPGISLLDVAVGVTGRAAVAAADVAGRVRPVLRRAVELGSRPPLLPQGLQPERWLAAVGDEGAERRARFRRAASGWLDVVVPVLVEEVARRAGLTEVAQRYVDLDKLIAGVNLDAAAAHLDVDAVVRRVDLDALMSQVDVDTVLDRVDVEAVVNRVDLDTAAGRLDLDRVLDRIDLTALILQRVDLDVLVQAVLGRLDLVKLAEDVIDGVDLPEIIRESTGSMASDTVRGVRMQGIVADEAVGNAVDRFLHRRGRRSTQAPAAGTPSRRAAGPNVPSQRVPGGVEPP